MTEKKEILFKDSPRGEEVLLNFNKTRFKTTVPFHPKNVLNIDSMHAIYRVLARSHFDPISNFSGDCFAVRLSLTIIALINSGNFKLEKHGSLEEAFYKACLENIQKSDCARDEDDVDLLLIYIKQTVTLLRSAMIIVSSRGSAVVAKKITSGKSLYLRLFHAFWIKLNWATIFPSDPDAARELKRNKNILKDILLNSYSRMELEKISNDFFDLTGFCEKDDLLMISFMDFYFFTWLKHFGIITYTHDIMNSAVSIEVTESGRKILNLFA